MRNRTAVTGPGRAGVGPAVRQVAQLRVVLVAVLALVACGGADADETEQVDGAASGDEQRTGGDGLAIPGWWPSDVALPTGLVLDSAAEDPGGTVALDLGGSVQGADLDSVVREQVAALETAGFEEITVDERSGTVTASRPTLGDLRFRFTQRNDAVSVTAVLQRVTDADSSESADRATSGVVTGDGPGTAIALLGGIQYVSEGECLDWSFSGAFGRTDAVINVTAGLDSTTGTALEYGGQASVTLPDGTTWWADEQVDFEATESGYGVFGTATDLSSADQASAPLQITVECRA